MSWVLAMPDWTDVLSTLDAPRPLPPSLRERLEAELLGDDVAGTLGGLDRPRALPPGLRRSLAARLSRPAVPVWRRPAVALAAAAAAVAGVLVGGALVAPDHHPGTTVAEPTPSSGALGPGAPVVAGGDATGTLGSAPSFGPALPLGTPAPSPSALGDTFPGGGAKPVPQGAAAAPGTGFSLSEVSPGQGPLRGGTRVVLTGQGLSRVVRVEVGGRPATALRVQSDSVVSAVTPARSTAGAVDVVAVLPSGERFGLSPGFVYLALPVVTGLDPSSGPMSGGTWVRVTGSAFTSDSRVVFGSTAAQQVVVESPTLLRALTPQHLPGYVDVRVTTAGGTSATGSGTTYLFTP